VRWTEIAAVSTRDATYKHASYRYVDVTVPAFARSSRPASATRLFSKKRA